VTTYVVLYGSYGVLIIVGALLHLALSKRPRTSARIVEVLLLYCLVIGVGVSGAMAVYAHTARAAETAESIGWPPGNPFQFEIAMTSLALAVLGFLCIWLRGNFWVATVIATSVFLLGAAYGHIQQILVARNYAPGNAGPVLYYDILLPLVMIALLIAHERIGKRDEARSA